MGEWVDGWMGGIKVVVVVVVMKHQQRVLFSSLMCSSSLLRFSCLFFDLEQRLSG
jgi:hypothetical protein